MNGIVITWPQLLYISLALILFYVAELMLFLRKSAARPQQADRHQQGDLLREVQELRQELEGLKVRVVTLLAQQAQQPEQNTSSEYQADSQINPFWSEETPVLGDTPYGQAIRLAQQGADAFAISHECGISQGEADLIVAIYRTAH